MSAETQGRIGNWRFRFRVWRWQRPFWAGLLTILAGGPIAYFPYAHINLGGLTLAMATTAGAGSLIIGVLLVVLGLTMWFQAVARVFAGVATIMLSLVSLVVSNIGGFLTGFLLGLIGGALAVAWGPGARPVEDPEHPAWLPKLPEPSADDACGERDEPTYEEAAHAAEHTAEAKGRNSAG